MDYEAFTRALTTDIRANGRPTSGPMQGQPLMILHTIGARSGQERESIVTYSREGDRYVIAATKSGAPNNPAWYHNLQAHSQVKIETGGETFGARATVVTGEDRDRLYAQHAEQLPQFREYPTMTDRVIPVILLDRNP
jgi:deazaflavin-dependent oxidoreductase (nitroreductase family)